MQGTEAANDWDIWVYPARTPLAAPADVIVATRWDESVKRSLAEGKKVLLFPKAATLARSLPGSFLPVFWSAVGSRTKTPWASSATPSIRVAVFPTDPYTNWQWYELLQNSRSMILDQTPATFRPIVQVIDNFARNHKLGNLFEAQVGPGRLLVCSIDLPGLAGKQLTARQLTASLYAYVGSDRFRPAERLDAAVLDKLFKP